MSTEVQNKDELTYAYDQMRSSLKNPGASPGDRKAIIRMTKEGVSPEEMSDILHLQLPCVKSLELEARRAMGFSLTDEEQDIGLEHKAREKASQEGVEYKKKKKPGPKPKLVPDGD